MILHHLKAYDELLNTTKSNNQLVQAYWVCLEQCDFIILGLKVLSWLTYKVTLLFLNMIDLSSQNDFFKILPQLYDDLSVKCLVTLSDCKVSYSFDMLESPSTVEKHVLGLVCVRAALHLATQ